MSGILANLPLYVAERTHLTPDFRVLHNPKAPSRHADGLVTSGNASACVPV